MKWLKDYEKRFFYNQIVINIMGVIGLIGFMVLQTIGAIIMIKGKYEELSQ